MTRYLRIADTPTEEEMKLLLKEWMKEFCPGGKKPNADEQEYDFGDDLP